MTFTASYECFNVRRSIKPTYRVRGILTDGFDSTVKSMRTLFLGRLRQLSPLCDQ